MHFWKKLAYFFIFTVYESNFKIQNISFKLKPNTMASVTLPSVNIIHLEIIITFLFRGLYSNLNISLVLKQSCFQENFSTELDRWFFEMKPYFNDLLECSQLKFQFASTVLEQLHQSMIVYMHPQLSICLDLSCHEINGLGRVPWFRGIPIDYHKLFNHGAAFCGLRWTQ